MDTITQAMLGAAIGQAGFARSLGPRARAWGAVAGLVPDLDVLAVATHGPFGEMLYHRGVTHSLWFGFALGPVLALVAQHVAAGRGRADPGPFGAWTALLSLALVTHPLLDWFTPYGTQLLAPFSRERFALDAVGIVDPFYSVPLALALAAGSLRALAPRRRARIAAAALAASTAYLFYGWSLNERLEARVARTLRAQAPAGEAVVVRAYPTLLQPWLRRVVARTGDVVRVGWTSALAPDAIRWQAFRPERDARIDALARTPEGRLFTWFAMDDTAARVRASDDGFVVEIDDLRYGVPGDPRFGMWGVRGYFDRDGALRGAVERFSRPRAADALDPAALLRAALGDLAALGRLVGEELPTRR